MIRYLEAALPFAFLHFSALGLVAIVSYLFGRRLTRSITYNSYWEQLSVSIALGLGCIAYAVLFLGLLGLLSPWILVIVLASGVILCYPIWSEWPRTLTTLRTRLGRQMKNNPKLVLLAILGVVLLASPFLILPLYPPHTYDGIMYHLPYARAYTENQGLIFTRDLRFPVSHQTNEMLFTLALILYDDVLAQLIEFLMLLTLTVATIAYGLRFFSKQAALWAGALLLSNPLLVWLGAGAYVEVGVTLFMTMSVYSLRCWLDGRERNWLILASVFCGLAVGVKLLALFIPLCFGLILLRLTVRERKYSPLVIFSLVSLAVASPWLFRSVYYTGNPLFPLFHEWFESSFGRWTAEPMQHLGVVRFGPAHWEHVTLGRFLLLPWTLTFGKRSPGAPSILSPIFFFSLPLIIMVAFKSDRIRWLLGLILAFLIFWFCTLPDMRFIVPILPLLSIVTAVAIEHVLHHKFPYVQKRISGPLLAVAGFIVLISPGWTYAVIKSPGPVPVTQKQRDFWLAGQLPAYPALQYLNRLKGRNYTVYTLFSHKMAYYAEGRLVAAIFVPGGYTNVFDGDYREGKLIGGRPLYQTLRRLGADYFMLETDEVPVKLPQDNFFKERFKLAYERSHLQLFELVEEPPR